LLIAFAPCAALAETCMRLLQNPDARRVVAEAGFDRFKSMPQTKSATRAGDAVIPPGAPPFRGG
jgi:hypothetical protein